MFELSPSPIWPSEKIELIERKVNKMATEDQKKLVANVLLDLARHIRRDTTAALVAVLSCQSAEKKREIAQAMIDVELGSVLLLCQTVLREPAEHVEQNERETEPEPVFAKGRIESLGESPGKTNSSPAD